LRVRHIYGAWLCRNGLRSECSPSPPAPLPKAGEGCAKRGRGWFFAPVLKISLFWLGFFWLTQVHAATLSITDDSNTQVTFDAPPQRIISLAPNITELAYAAGLGSRVVAVTAYSDYPEAAKQLPQVGDAFNLDWERIVALKPDLVLAWRSGLSARDRAAFEKLQLQLLVLEPHRLDDIPKALRLLGRVAGMEPEAESAARDFERQRAGLLVQYAGRSPVRAYFQIADVPMLTVNGEHIISDVLQLCGAQNVFAAAPVLTPAVSDEALVKAQPQILLGIADTQEQRERMRGLWRKLPLRAARDGRMAFVTADSISRAAPRILQGAATVCEEVAAARRQFSAE
jgi:iron complex transport system substrate-binding protein